MKPVEKREIDNLQRDYRNFCSLGHSELKALWLTVSGRGYVEIIGSNRDSIMVLRRRDCKYVVVSYPLKEMQEIKTKIEVRKVLFHTDTKNLTITSLIV